MSNRVVALENPLEVPVGTLGTMMDPEMPYPTIAWDGMPHNPYPICANEYKYLDEENN